CCDRRGPFDPWYRDLTFCHGHRRVQHAWAFYFLFCVLVREAAYYFNFLRASIAARALLRPFLEPEWSLATMSVIPASSSTGRTDEPATKPRPRAGMSDTTDAVNFAWVSYGIELFLVKATVIIFFLALRTALSIAS